MTPSELAEALATAEQTVQNAKYGMEAMDSRPAVLARALLTASSRLTALEAVIKGVTRIAERAHAEGGATANADAILRILSEVDALDEASPVSGLLPQGEAKHGSFHDR